MSLRLCTLGGLSLTPRDGGVPGRSTQRKRLALLALLAASRHGSLSRDRLIAYLWPESDTEQARHALSQALYALRRELGEDSIIAGIDELRLNHQAVPSDVARLNAAIADRDSQQVVAAYGGPFLDGFHLPDAPEFEDWAAQRRAEYERAYANALDELAARALEAGEPQRAVAWLQARAALDPLSSPVALRLMQAHAAAGDRAGALRCFRTHAALLRAEMQLEPGPELTSFAEECARTNERSPARATAAPATPVEPFPPAPAPRTTEAPRRRRMSAGRVALGVGLIAIVVVALLAGQRRTAAPASDVLLAAVTGPDSSLALAVREALRAELEQSQGARVLGDAVAARTLELMRLPPTTPLEEARAVEVALRRGIPFVITASVQPVGTGVQIVARMVDASTGRVVATATERPNREADVLQAVAAIAGEMSERVPRIEAPARSPLPAVTTASLPALRNYALARRALAEWDRTRALELLESALVHDSTFALAHYLAGDLLWYLDSQRHSDEHMQRALELSDRLPPRERLIVRARYQQLVRDEPDSALHYWTLLVNSYPDEPLAYEGLRWVYRALGRTKEMADVSERGYQHDATQRRNYYWDRSTERLEAGDSSGALEAAAMASPTSAGRVVQRTLFLWQIGRGRLPPLDSGRNLSAADRQIVELLHHRFDSAAMLLDSLRRASLQYYPRALLAQARMEWEFTRSTRAQVLLDEVVDWIDAADLSPPAYARLCERAAELAAQIGDRDALRRLRDILDRQDRDRGLRSFRYARATIDAADALVRQDYGTAVAESMRASEEMFFARSVATVLLLRSQALARNGQHHEARRILQQVAQQRGFTDGDWETRGMMAHIAAHRLARDGS